MADKPLWKVTFKDGSTDVVDEDALNRMSENDVANASLFESGAKSSVSKHLPWGAKSSVAQHRAETTYRPGDAYTLARSAISVPVGAVMGGLEYAKDRAFKEGSWAGGQGKPITSYMTEGMGLGNAGEGATGMIATPTNFLPALRASSLGKQFLASALHGGAIGALDRYEAGGDDLATGGAFPSARDALVSTGITAGLSGGLGLFGRGTREFAANQYPNYSELMRTAEARGGAAGAASMGGAIRDVMGSTKFPYRQAEVAKAVDLGRQQAGKGFDEAVAAIPESRDLNLTFDPSGDITHATTASGQPIDFYSDLEHQLYHPRDIDVAWNVHKVKDLAKAQAIADLQASTIHKVNSAAVDKAIDARVKDLEYKLGVQKSKYPEMPADVQADVFGVTGDIKDIKDFSKLRRAYSSQFKNSANPDERVANYADELIHGGIVGSMERIPEYSEAILRSGAKQKYATYKALEEMVSKKVPVPTGLGRKHPELFNTYVGPNLLYKGGRLIENNASRISNALTRGLIIPKMFQASSDASSVNR